MERMTRSSSELPIKNWRVGQRNYKHFILSNKFWVGWKLQIRIVVLVLDCLIRENYSSRQLKCYMFHPYRNISRVHMFLDVMQICINLLSLHGNSRNSVDSSTVRWLLWSSLSWWHLSFSDNFIIIHFSSAHSSSAMIIQKFSHTSPTHEHRERISIDWARILSNYHNISAAIQFRTSRELQRKFNFPMKKVINNSSLIIKAWDLMEFNWTQKRLLRPAAGQSQDYRGLCSDKKQLKIHRYPTALLHCISFNIQLIEWKFHLINRLCAHANERRYVQTCIDTISP